MDIESLEQAVKEVEERLAEIDYYGKGYEIKRIHLLDRKWADSVEIDDFAIRTESNGGSSLVVSYQGETVYEGGTLGRTIFYRAGEWEPTLLELYEQKKVEEHERDVMKRAERLGISTKPIKDQ